MKSNQSLWSRQPGFFSFVIALVLASVLTWGSELVWAGGTPSINVMQGGRANLRDKSKIRSEILGRVDLAWSFWDDWQLAPFGEVRRDVDLSTWSRIELGAELGRQVTPWMYLASALHQAWVSPGNDRPELEFRTLLSFPLRATKFRSKPLSLYAFNEYSFDLEAGEGIRNEMGAGIKVPLPVKRFSLLLGWRHVDLISSDDVDQFESSLHASF